MSPSKIPIKTNYHQQRQQHNMNISANNHVFASTTTMTTTTREMSKSRIDCMLSEKITQRARRRPPSIFPSTTTTTATTMHTLKLGLFILSICPLVLLSNGLAITFHQQERSHRSQSDSMHHNNRQEQQLKDQPPHHETPRHHQRHQQPLKLDNIISAASSDSVRLDQADDLSLVNGHFEPLVAEDSFSPLSSSYPSSQTGRGIKTLYACEQKQLDVECQSGDTIQLIQANYGQFSIQICNVPGQPNWKVDCVSSDNAKLTPNRRLIKRSGISDQRLAEIQMIRALKKQFDKASKLAASNNGSGSSSGQEATS